MKKEHSKSTLPLLWRFLKGAKRFFAASILCAAITALADMLQPQIIRAAVDCAIGGKEGNFPQFVMDMVNSIGGFAFLGKNLWIMALAVVGVAVVQVGAQYAFRVFNTKASETLVKTMRDSLFSHIEHLPFAWHMKNKTGDIIQRCTSDIDTTKNFLSEQLTSVFRIVLLLALSITFMLSMHPILTLIALIPTPAIILYSFHFHRKIHDGFLDCDENEGKLSAMAQENLTGVRVVRAFGRERAEIEKFEKQNDHYAALWEKMAKVLSRFWSVSDILSGLQVMLVVVFGAYYCVHGNLQPGAYIAFISYNTMLVWPIRQLGRMISEMSKAGVSIDRVAYIMHSPVEQDEADCQDAPMDGDIRFEKVSFRYENGPEILHDIDFTVKAGTTLGILGGTGSGKTTLMLLLDKLYLWRKEKAVLQSAARISAKSGRPTCERTSALFCRSPICSPGPLRKILRSARNRWIWKRSGPQQKRQRWMKPSTALPQAMIPWWVSGALPCPADKSSGRPLPEPCYPKRPYWCLTILCLP